MNEIGNVSMPQLIGCYFKVQTVSLFSVMSSLVSQDRCDCMLYSFSIFIPIIAPLLDRPRNNILPKSLKLRVGCLLYTSGRAALTVESVSDAGMSEDCFAPQAANVRHNTPASRKVGTEHCNFFFFIDFLHFGLVVSVWFDARLFNPGIQSLLE